MVTRLVFGILGLITLSASAVTTPVTQKEYLLLQLQNPHLSIPTKNGTKTPPDQSFSIGVAGVNATNMGVRWQASGLEVEGNQLRLGNILGRLQLGHLTGKVYYQTPEVYWHWGPRVRWHQRERQAFDFTTLGVGLISKRSLAVALPSHFRLKMTYEKGKITRELVNRDEVNAYLTRQVFRLFDEAVFARDFTTYTVGVNAYLDVIAQDALTRLGPTVARTVRDGVMEEIGSPAFIDSMLDEVFQKLPALRFAEGASAELEWTRGRNGAEPVWHLVYTRAGTAPSPGLTENWAPTGDATKSNRLRIAVTPDALQHLVEDTVQNFNNVETPPGWPEALTVDTTRREMVYRPKTASEIQTMRIPFALLFPRHTIVGDPDLVLGIDWKKDDNFKFRRDGSDVVIEAKLQAALASQTTSDRTPALPIQIRAWFTKECELKNFEVKPLSVTNAGSIELFDLAPAMGVILRQSLGFTPQTASQELGRYFRTGLIGEPAEALTIDVLEPLPIP